MSFNKKFFTTGGIVASTPAAAVPTNTDNFDIVTYTGTNGTNSISSLDFSPDLVWIKNRDFSVGHFWTDRVRGAGNYLQSDNTNIEDSTSRFNSFDTNGFTVSTDTALLNNSSYNYVAWCWKGGGTAVSNTDGSITASVSANTDAGFSIGTYSGNNTAGATIGHGLSATPELIIVKLRSGISAKAWTVYAESLGNTKYLYLNDTLAAGTYNFWNNTSPTDSVFSVSSDTNVNSSSGNYVFYAFHSVDGYQKVGSYTGTGASGNSVTTGFAPRFVMIKDSTNAGHWIIHSKPPTTSNPSATHLRANLSAAEDSGSGERISFDTNGFTIEGTGGNVNTNNDTYIYLAIA